LRLLAIVGLAATLAMGATPTIVLNPAPSPIVGKNPQSVAVGDFNGDGKWDLAVANFGSDNVSILLGNGDGTFGPAKNFGVGTGPFFIAVGDFDGDGKLDLAVANLLSSNVSILLGKGDGTFCRAPGCGLPPAPDPPAGTDPSAVAVGDFDKDGKLDLAVANFSDNNVSILLGKGNGTFSAPSNFAVDANPRWVASGDFNNDGKLDLAVANSGSTTVSILLGKGDGTFAAAMPFGADFLPFSVAVGDFNGDGKADLAVANNGSNNVSILLGKGNGTFGTPNNLAAGFAPFAVALGDLNGDGKLDVVVTNNGGDTLSVFAGNGDGTFAAGTSFSAGTRPKGLVVWDFNNDGKPDVAIASSSSDSLAMLMNNTVIQAPNQPPVANAGPDQTVECSGSSGAQATLSGSGTDPDGDPLTYMWTDEHGNVVGTSAMVTLWVPLGTHTFKLTVDDGHSHTASDLTNVTVGDTTAPLLSLVLSPTVLWPPNHRMVKITASIQVSDTCDLHPTVVLVSVVSNEPDSGLGEADRPHDIQGASVGTDDRSFFLRAERGRRGHGRVYIVTYRARDASGNATFKSAEVRVPHNRRRLDSDDERRDRDSDRDSRGVDSDSRGKKDRRRDKESR
jgi:hypothetical protein